MLPACRAAVPCCESRRAIYAFETKARFDKFAGMVAAVSDATGRMLHDAVLAERLLLNNVLVAVLQPSMESSVTTPCLELVHPIQGEGSFTSGFVLLIFVLLVAVII